MDGSAAPFVFLMQAAGIVEQEAAKRFVRIKRPVMVEERNKWVRFEPFNGFKVNFTIDFDHPVFRRVKQRTEVDFSTTSFIKEVSRARTFGFLKDLNYLRERNLAKGGTLDNVVVIGDDHILNSEGLRYSDEFVMHKVLDAIGDLYLLGHSVIGGFTGYRSGHALNNRLLKRLLRDRNAYEIVSFADNREAPIFYAQPLHAV